MKKSATLSSLGTAALMLMISLLASCANKGDRMSSTMLSRSSVERHVATWPDASKKAVMATMDKYGEPSGVTPMMIIWENSGPYKRTIAYKEPVQHDFPMPHPDVLETFINYEVPEDMVDELAMYDGSVILERTKGEMSARCDQEPLNILALNLAHEIATGKRSVEEARKFYGEQAMAFKNKQSAPYTQRLMFTPPADRTANDPDEPLKMKGM